MINDPLTPQGGLLRKGKSPLGVSIAIGIGLDPKNRGK